MKTIDYQTAVIISNAAFTGCCLGLSFIFLRSIYRLRRDFPRSWYSLPETKSAIALAGIFIAGLIARKFALTLLVLRSWGYDTTWLEGLGVPLISGVVFVISAGCLARVWTQNNREWIIMILITLGFIIVNVASEGPFQATF